MKTNLKLIVLLCMGVCCCLTVNGQTLKGLNFQGIARSNTGELIANQLINLEISVLEGAENGPAIYVEDHSPMTNAYALFSIVVGKGTPSSGLFEMIPWGENDFFLRVELNGALVAVTQLEAVPYSKVATQMSLGQLVDVFTPPSPTSGDVLKFTGSEWEPALDAFEDADPDPNNEIQMLSRSGNTIQLSSGGGTVVDEVDDADPNPNNELQTLSKTGSTINLSNGGGSVTDAVNDADANPSNELQTLSLSGQNLSLSDGGGMVSLPSGHWNASGSKIYYNSGNVGIGTNNPGHRLDLVDAGNNADLYIEDSFPFVFLNSSSGTGNSGLKFEDQGGYTGWIYHVGYMDAIYISGENTSVAQPNIAVASNGRVGIGTGTPSYPLHLAKDTMSINGLEIANLGSANLGLDGDIVPYLGSSGGYDLGNNNATEHWDDVTATSFITFSDVRTKNHISPLPVGLSELMALQPVQFKYNPEIDIDGRLRFGLIAQEVEKVLPNIVVQEDVDVNPESGVIERTPSQYKAMNYMELIPVLIQAIQEQQTYIHNLEQRIEQLENP